MSSHRAWIVALLQSCSDATVGLDDAKNNNRYKYDGNYPISKQFSNNSLLILLQYFKMGVIIRHVTGVYFFPVFLWTLETIDILFPFIFQTSERKK